MKAIKNTLRFFVPPAVLRENEVILSDPDLVHQLSRVLRLRPGAEIALLDGNGECCLVELMMVERQQISGRVLLRAAAAGDPPGELVLYLALIRHERFEWALQKAVELGYTQIHPTRFERSHSEGKIDERRIERWQRIMREAAEQSGRGRLPQLGPVQAASATWPAAKQTDLALLLDEATSQPLARLLRSQPYRSVAVWSGPEGGLSDAERSAANAHGIIPVSLGPRILRAETAPLAAAALILAELETTFELSQNG